MSQSLDPIHAAPMCASTEFLSMYNDDNISTDILSDEALANIIQPNAEFLRAADRRYRLDDLLSAMLAHAPHQLGKRYIAVTLHVAHRQGMAAVVDVAESWMDHLFLPLLKNSVNIKEPSDDPQSDEYILRDKVSIREQRLCAITRTLDTAHARLLRRRGLLAPAGGARWMTAAHIIPPTLSHTEEANTSLEIAFPCFRCSSLHPSIQTIDHAGMDIFISWTGIDPEKLSKLQSPANAILMTMTEALNFGQFEIYFDKDVHPNVPHKYRVKLIGSTIRLSCEVSSMDVEFRTGVEGIEPPDPEYLAIHAAIAKVVNICGAASYVESLKWDADHENLYLNMAKWDSEDSPLDAALLSQSSPVDCPFITIPKSGFSRLNTLAKPKPC